MGAWCLKCRSGTLQVSHNYLESSNSAAISYGNIDQPARTRVSTRREPYISKGSRPGFESSKFRDRTRIGSCFEGASGQLAFLHFESDIEHSPWLTKKSFSNENGGL